MVVTRESSRRNIPAHPRSTSLAILRGFFLSKLLERALVDLDDLLTKLLAVLIIYLAKKGRKWARKRLRRKD